MEDTWHAKCSSTRAPPPPEPSSAPSLATPTSLLPSLSAGSVNCKMSRNSKKFSHSSAQEMSLGDAAICQGSMVFNTLNLDSRKSEKGGMTNSFLDLLSGNSQNLSTDIRQTLNSRTPPAKHQIHDNIGVNGASCGLPVTSTPLLLGNQGNAATVNRGLSPFVASPTSNLTGTKAPLLHDSIQAAAFPCHGRDSRKLPRTFQGNISAMEVSSGRQGWPTSSSSSSSNANQKHILNPTSQAMPLEDKRSVSNVTSAFRGRPHVFCMNKVGELFVTEMGLLGVLCFCHKLPMSVANFCEHSGSLSANPGEAVRLENGMTVSQWRMLCSGIMASDHDYGWDWSNDSSAQSIFHRSKLSNYPASAKNPIPVNSMEAFGGLRRFAEPGDNFSFTDHIYTAQHGQTDLEKSTNKVADNAYNRNNLMRYNPFTKSFTASLQRMTPVLSNKYTAQGGKENPVSISFQGASSNYNKREGNIGLQLAQNNVNYKSEVGNLPVSFAYSETKDSSLCSQNMSRGIFLSEAYVLDKEGASSNVELSLGHPFQNMHPPQLGTTCNSQNPHQPQPLTHITDFPKEAKRPRLDLGGTSSGTPLLNRRKLYHSGRSNSSKGFESDPMSDATKNSLISFLSHLNNEANNPSQSTVDIGNYNECFMSKVHDRDSLHAKCNLSGFMRGKADGIEWKIHTNKSAVSSDVGRGTEPGVICDGSYSILKPNHLVHNKQTADVRLPASEHFIQSRFVDDNKQTELNIDQPSGMLHTISDTRNFEQAQMSLSLTKSTYIPEQTSDLSCKKNNDTTQSLNDERLRYLSQRNMDELSKTERCTSSLEMNPHHRRFCCLSDVKFQKNICGDEPDAPERLRDSCIIQRDAYKTDVRSGRSFSGCCGCDHQVVATRSGKPGSYQCCNCSASTQRTLFCSKDHGIQFSTCHLCGANKQPCLRLCTISSNSSGNPKHEVGNLKVESPSSGKCCCTASPKYLTGCCFSGGDILSNVLNGHVCGKAKVAHVYPNPPYDNMHMLQDEKVVRLGQCECSRKNVMKNNSRIAVWRDVPSKAVGHSGTTSNEKPSNIPHTARASGDQVTETATKELEETQKESDSIKEQQMSNVCSGSSAPAVTEASFEVNNAISFVTDAENAKAMDDLVVDEGSRIEKCGSSDEALDNVCEKANILKNKTKTIKYGLHYLPSSSSVDLVDELTLKNSSNLKCLKNQNDAVCAAEKITSQIRKLDWSGKAVKRKRWSKFDFASPFSEFSEHVGPSSHNSSSNEIEPPSQLECVMQKAAKRKRSALSSTKALPPKGHENHHKVGEIEYRKMLSIDDDRCLRKHTVLVGMKAKQHTSNIVKQKHNNATAGKPPKFLSLSCIGNLNNFDTDTACKKARPVVCDNLGVISTGLCDQEKPAKIVPLSLVLKKSTRCYITESEGERKAAFASKTHLTDSGCYMVSSSSKLQHVNADFSTINNGTEPTILVSGDDHHTPDLSQKMIKLASTLDAGLANNIQNEQAQAGDLFEVNRRRSCKGNKCESFLQDSNAFCSVCGSSNKGDVNHLLECNRCLVRVHQACYGVVKVPKGRWCCRPCKTNSLNIVCVLCGYGGGAMTRALKSEHIAKGLLKAWKIGVEPDPISSITENKFLKQSPVNEESERKGLIVGESFSSDAYPTDVSKRGLHKTNNIQHSDCSENNHEACNSITAGVLDPSVTQWVHMVCGLWTPGTRCPNVDTMSTFDVSGASPSRKKMVCAMCNRSGGSCIQCRVLNCTVRFHPWCAHQKGLLQSEIEGDNNEKVGFYGRCVHHATHNISHIHSLPVGPEVESPGKKDWTCARTKGFKGRKRDEGFNPDHQKPYNDGGGCIVSQEQINAWLHINGHKSCIRGVTKPRCSEMEYGIQFAKGSFSLMQKEYLRYKQTKGWKHLVVYKSGIHALGLYTSQFITRGAMVVEYVGEIVSLRVADKRELEYQSGRKLQYKSACYFFRIDKEHIIDATRKGGIARFVNHSCLPNCVAKIISVRNEKKVVFFAERDIYPGEEITYDYHFNHEDEGEKIPCFCNSKNCRLYLN